MCAAWSCSRLDVANMPPVALPTHHAYLPLILQSMMGPYTMYGLAGAGAGLLFYLVAGRTGGPVSIPGVASTHYRVSLPLDKTHFDTTYTSRANNHTLVI